MSHRLNAASAALAATLTFSSGAAAQPNPCSLLTAAEISTALGTTVPELKSAGGSFCTAVAGNLNVTVRAAKRTTPPGTEAKGLEKLKQTGAQVEVKTFGPVTCSSIGGGGLPGYNTTCSVFKEGIVAAIEVATKDKSAAVTIDRLRPLGEKIAARF